MVYIPNGSLNLFPILIPFIIGLFLFIKDDYKRGLLISTPILVTFLFVLTHNYPQEERFFLFLMPSILIICLYPLVVLNNKFKKSVLFLILIFLFWSIDYLLFIPSNSIHRIHKYAVPSTQIWNYWLNNYQKDGSLIFSDATTLGLYYFKLYGNDSIKYNILDERQLKSGTYYLIITSFYSKGKKEVENLLKLQGVKIVDAKLFSVQTSTDYIRQSFYMKFVKPD